MTKKSECYLAYVAGAGQEGHHVLKIGHSKNLFSRFEELSAMAWSGPSKFEVTLGTGMGREIEKSLHEQLKKFRIHHEWFHVPEDEMSIAKELVSQKYGTVFAFVNLEGDVE